MGQTKTRNKNERRPRKKATARRRRERVQRKRLIALGVSEKSAAQLDASAVRSLLRRPALLQPGHN